MTYLLDTNVVVDYLRSRGSIAEQLRSLAGEGLALSIISVAELYEGVYRARDPERAETVLQNFLTEVVVMPVDHEVSRIFGSERARLRSKGTPLSDLDLLIGATALRHQLTLFSRDRAFERMTNLQVLQPTR